MKSSILWDIMPHNLVKINLRFGGTYHLQLQGQIAKSASFLLHVGFLFGLLSDRENGGGIFV
jgi:hypothetical protein